MHFLQTALQVIYFAQYVYSKVFEWMNIKQITVLHLYSSENTALHMENTHMFNILSRQSKFVNQKYFKPVKAPPCLYNMKK